MSIRLLPSVVLYQATPQHAKSIVNSMVHCDAIALFDNGVTKQIKEIINEARIDKANLWLGNGSNVGLSAAYNRILDYAGENGYKCVLLLDQDTIIEPDFLETAKKVTEQHNDRTRIGLYCPEVVINNSSNRQKNFGALRDPIQWAISSGSIIVVNAFKAIGGFDERYGIDRVDVEYCYRLKMAQYKIKRVPQLVINQTLGYSSGTIFRFSGNHTASRHYYIARNRLLFVIETLQRGGLTRYLIAITLTLRHLAIIVLFEDQKIAKIKKVILGVRDFVFRIFGFVG